jgi:hypothetical protein
MGSKEEETAQARQDEDVNLSSEKWHLVPVAIENTLIEAGGAPNPWGGGAADTSSYTCFVAWFICARP